MVKQTIVSGIRNIAESLLKMKTEVELSNIEYSLLPIDELDVEIPETDTYARYYPAQSKPQIEYYIKKIAYGADQILSKVAPSLMQILPKELILNFIPPTRLALLSVVRQHEIFHYLFERASRGIHGGLSGELYSRYSKQVYLHRKKLGKGNLEEALADAYAFSSYEQSFQQVGIKKVNKNIVDDYMNLYYKNKYPNVNVPHNYLNPIVRMQRNHKRRINKQIKDSIEKIIQLFLLKSKRPPGYQEAKYYTTEISNLFKRQYEDDFVNRLENIRSVTWLYDELRRNSCHDPKDGKNEIRKFINPNSKRDFLIFIENFITLYSGYVHLLPLPLEKIR